MGNRIVNNMGTIVSSQAQPTANIMRADAQIMQSVSQPNILRSAGNIIFPQMHVNFANNSHLISANNVADVRSFTYQINSAPGAGAASIRIFTLQNSELPTVTDNGSGANSITYAWQDANGGKTISRIIRYGRAGVGVICFGGTIRVDQTPAGASSVGYAPGVAALAPYFATYNEFGLAQPLTLNAAADQTRKDQDTSIFVFSCVQNLSDVTQLSMVIPGDNAGNTYTITVTLYVGEENFSR